MKILLLIIFIAVSGLSQSQSLKTIDKADLSSKDYLKQLDNQVFISYAYIYNPGNFGETYKNGDAFYINYGKYFPNNWLVVFRSGYIKHNIRSTVDSGGFKNFNIIPLHVGGRYYLYKNVIMPYFSFMNGINIISASDFVGNPEQGDQNKIKYAYQVGFGFDVKFARQFGINLNINFNNSFYEDYDLYEEQNSKMMSGFEYGAGLIYNFGK